jgi:hypothetical protein
MVYRKTFEISFIGQIIPEGALYSVLFKIASHITELYSQTWTDQDHSVGFVFSTMITMATNRLDCVVTEGKQVTSLSPGIPTSEVIVSFSIPSHTIEIT